MTATSRSGSRAVVLVLGDQLSPGLASLKAADAARDIVVMAEVIGEATYVRHHKQKIAFVFSSMRHFAAELRDAGFTVDYVRLDDAGNSGSLAGEAERALKRHKAGRLLVTEAGEWRLDKEMREWAKDFDHEVTILPDDRFLCSRDDFADWAEGRKQLRMEHFYREMRRNTGLLMDGEEPVGGKWNLDAQNRQALPGDVEPPKRRTFRPDDITKEVLDLVENRFADHFGELHPFHYPVTRGEAEGALAVFIEERLPDFGIYQDAMRTGAPFLYHSVISAALNVGLLDPMEVCKAAEKAYRDGKAPLNAVEGFIRQIIGWREYVRGLYWLKMPEYKSLNVLQADRPLPSFYWTGETDLACLADAIATTRDNAYAHHIQRLMITGNFALLAGLDPDAVNEWYMIVYADAYEWVELPNTHGMALYADGGIMASKPYAASGSYINKMSDYCADCAYSVSAKNGEKACPFNYLYWDFLMRHEDRLKGNRRLSMPYATLKRFSDDRRAEIRADAARFLDQLA